MAMEVDELLLYVYIDVKEMAMQKKMTISIDETVYKGLMSVIGKRKVSKFLEDLARPHVVTESLAVGYQAMAADGEREQEAQEWCEALAGDTQYEAR